MQKRTRLALVISSLVTAVVALTLAACGGGGGSDSAPVSDLAKFVPPDAAVYIQGSLHPDSEVQAKADAISEKLTGSSLGEQLQGAISSGDSSVDFKTDVEPWLGDAAAMFIAPDALTGGADGAAALAGAGDSPYGMVLETSSADDAQAFIDKQAKGGGTGEFEGVQYAALKGDNSIAGILDDNFVSASDATTFKAMVSAQKGDSLEGDAGFSEVVDKVAAGSLVNVFVGGAATSGKVQGADYSGLYKAFGVDPEKAGAMFSLVPEDNEISIKGYTASQPDLSQGDATDLIASFPEDSVFALGTGDLGKNATKVIETIDKEGIEGMVKPGQLGKSLDQITEQGIDIRSIIENLNDLGLFVQGSGPQNLGGALVLTSSDLDSVRSSFKTIVGLIKVAGGGPDVKPLGGGMTGLRVNTPDLPGRPVVFAVGKDRVVIGIGMPASIQALKAEGPDLGSSPEFTAARDSVGGALMMYADPAVLANVLSASTGADPQTAQFVDILGKFSYMAAGSGSEEGSGEINFGLK